MGGSSREDSSRRTASLQVALHCVRLSMKSPDLVWFGVHSRDLVYESELSCPDGDRAKTVLSLALLQYEETNLSAPGCLSHTFHSVLDRIAKFGDFFQKLRISSHIEWCHYLKKKFRGCPGYSFHE